MVCVGPGRKPECLFSHDAAHIKVECKGCILHGRVSMMLLVISVVYYLGFEGNVLNLIESVPCYCSSFTFCSMLVNEFDSLL